MPQKNPGTSYTGKPVRRLKLPKIGPTKTTNLFEEYLYALLAVVFFAVTILGKAGGFSGYDAVVIGAWVTAILWCAHQLKDYFVEKSKPENGKTPAPQPQARTESPKGPSPLPANMKPMIGPQWPVKPSVRPSWPKLPKGQPSVAAQPQAIQPPVATSTQTSETNSNEKKRVFVYERPTLPDRTPKLPHNWADVNDKKPNDKKRDNKKPKR
jgi:hypothetical protein